MADNFTFDRDTYKNEFEKLKLTKNQKEILLDKMRAADKNNFILSEKNEKSKNIFRFIPIRAVAASLVVALIFSAIYLGSGNSSENSHNSFRLVANAAETGELQEITDSDVIIGSGKSESGFSMMSFTDSDTGIYTNKYGKQDYFSVFELDNLKVVGTNIESISFYANKKGTYFIISPESTDNLNTPYNSESSKIYGETTNENKDTESSIIKSWLAENFINIKPITNSVYTEEEFENYFTGYYGKVCNGFTYKNTQTSKGEQTVSLDYSTALILESNRTDGEIDGYLNEIKELQNKINELRLSSKNNESNKLYYSTDEENELGEQIEEKIYAFNCKILEGATIKVSVKFEDGTVEAQTLQLSYDNENGLSGRLAE